MVVWPSRKRHGEFVGSIGVSAGGVVYGILCIESTGPRLLDTDDQRRLLALADQVDMAIEYNQLYEALEARRERVTWDVVRFKRGFPDVVEGWR